MKQKILFILSDGMGDTPSKKLSGKTPLEAAETPNLNKMAELGQIGLMHVLKPGVIPHSDEAHLTLFGYDLRKHYVGRGPFEALGLGMHLKQGDIAFRCNFSTVSGKLIVRDRRAGRIKNVAELCKKLNNLKVNGIRFLVKPGTSHRAAVVMRGEGLSDKICDSDPHREGVKVRRAKACDKSKQAKFTAGTLNEFLKEAHKILEAHPANKARKKKGLKPANYLLLRGAGKMKAVPSIRKRFGLKAVCIAGAGLYKGVAAFVGMKILKVKGATGTPKTSVKAKIGRAIKELKSNDLVFVHVKGCDIFGHDGDCVGKKKFIEKIDRAIKPVMKLDNVLVAVTADHSTPCARKDHSNDPVPVLFYGSMIEADSANEFSERKARNKGLGVLHGKNFMKLMLKETGRA